MSRNKRLALKYWRLYILPRMEWYEEMQSRIESVFEAGAKAMRKKGRKGHAQR